jgi:hypothetical protein
MAVVSFWMLPSCLLDLAQGTDFDVTCDDSNCIAIKIQLAEQANMAKYQQLVEWLT